MLAKPLTHEELVYKRAFKRACEMAGGNTEMGRLLGIPKQIGQVSKWLRDDYPDVLPARLFNVVDRIAGYPVMKEAMCSIDGYELRAIENEDPDMPLKGLVSIGLGDATRALQAVMEAKADNLIEPREAHGIEDLARKCIQTFQHIIDASHAEAAKGQTASVVPMQGDRR